ncbi:Mur ligase [Chytridium lagenaria]|nr:Mur ligase [Chytridium lagenaria]
MSLRNYETAVKALNNTQTNAAVLEMLRKSGNSLNKSSLPEMREFLAKIGYQNAADLKKLNVLHIAGTKGKGSTAAFCDSILRRCFVNDGSDTRPLRTGLFTSPHLTEVRERIRINGVPISQEKFAKYFYNIRDRFSPDNSPDVQLPGYFRYLFLMACEAFVQEKVDVVIMECGIGGSYDATNVLEYPVVSAITSLGFDHMGLLGETLPEIAWHKAGIMKKGVPAFTIIQREDALKVLHDRGVELEAGNPITRPDEAAVPVVIGDKDVEALANVKLGISGDHQYLNAALAVAVCKEWVAQMKKNGASLDISDELIKKGLELTTWPGRSDVLSLEKYPLITWCLDGAHTPESLNVCAKWFVDELVQRGKEKRKILVFSCTGNRSVKELLEPLATIHKTGYKFDKVMFCGTAISPKLQKNMKAAWEELNGSVDNIDIFKTADDALAVAAAESHPALVLVTGSLHLVGSMISLLDVNVR